MGLGERIFATKQAKAPGGGGGGVSPPGMGERNEQARLRWGWHKCQWVGQLQSVSLSKSGSGAGPETFQVASEPLCMFPAPAPSHTWQALGGLGVVAAKRWTKVGLVSLSGCGLSKCGWAGKQASRVSGG